MPLKLLGRYRRAVMDINHVLLLIAVLNLLGDLYNILRFRQYLPGWLLPANISALSLCAASWLLFPEQSGVLALTVLICYVVAVKAFTRRRAPAQRLPAPATKFLISVNLCFFGYQFVNHATDDPSRFVELGALFTPLLAQGEWWRLITAQYMHWGAMHLFCNMLGLWFLGPVTEALLGPVRFILSYLACGTLGMLIAYWLSPHPLVLLGASASVLGLVGIQGALALKAYRRTGSPVAKAQLSSMGQIVILQAIFDTMVPEVSSTAHIGGAAVGFLIGLASTPRRF